MVNSRDQRPWSIMAIKIAASLDIYHDQRHY